MTLTKPLKTAFTLLLTLFLLVACSAPQTEAALPEKLFPAEIYPGMRIGEAAKALGDYEENRFESEGHVIWQNVEVAALSGVITGDFLVTDFENLENNTLDRFTFAYTAENKADAASAYDTLVKVIEKNYGVEKPSNSMPAEGIYLSPIVQYKTAAGTFQVIHTHENEVYTVSLVYGP
ncbi:MAG: hypothetical protein ACOX3W_03910 [Christensenellaceae bacterium]|jgi:hypothetical protein